MKVSDFLGARPSAIVERLALDDARRFRHNEPQQVRAWEAEVRCLREALSGWAEAAEWELEFEFPILRLGRRIDAVLVTPRAVAVLEFKVGSGSFHGPDRQQVWDYALDLQDFHAACRDHPVVPILVATEAWPGPVIWPLMLAGATSVLDASAASLPRLLRDLWARLPDAPPLATSTWAQAPYSPVPTIIDAARTLYARNTVDDIAQARADRSNLGATTAAILAAIAEAREGGQRLALFVTGIPGAGKTLCGLNVIFGAGRSVAGGPGEKAAFLTGNPTLVHVLREALARDAAAGARGAIEKARREAKTSIQALPFFRDHYVKHADHPPAEHVIVIDEAQRAWSAHHAVSKSQKRDIPLRDSEPGHLLDIMARRTDWAVVVCLIGNGQEIHDGEGGLAEWGNALAMRAGWTVLAAPGALTDPTERQRLPALPGLRTDPTLHLDVPIRSIRSAAAAPWVDAMLRGDAAAARRIADRDGPVPFRLTRDLAAQRIALRHSAIGLRRAGLVASSGAKRLRADGLGAELPHMDDGAVANWFLDRWPDVRASDALEVVATEFSCQGLELDFVGMCWGGDLIRGRLGWQVRRFAGTAWQTSGKDEKIDNRINTYRVLLTRARYETVIWVPRGDAADQTRSPAEFDDIADFLAECGVQELALAPLPAASMPRQAVLI